MHSPTIYVITYHKFNHEGEGRQPIDDRFLNTEKNYVFYLIDKETPESLINKNILHEYNIDPELYRAGGLYFAEWSFLLAEAERGFCSYPFFMISSRFYEKNGWLKTDLNKEWDKLFGYFDQGYEYGFLPSYCRPLRWCKLNWNKYFKRKIWRPQFFPWSEKVIPLVKDLFNVRIPEDYGWASDLACHYIGFRDKKALLDYVNFYKPLINHFFDENYKPIKDLNQYIKQTGAFRNEKPFTFLLEGLAHLYFFAENKPLFTMHYEGYYHLSERNTYFEKIAPLTVPGKISLRKKIGWLVRKYKSEGFCSILLARIKMLLSKYNLKISKI